MNKKDEIKIKEEKVLDKEFKNLNKIEDAEIKEEECLMKLNATKSKAGEKITKSKILDNTTKKGKILRSIIVFSIFAVLIVGGFFALKQTGLLSKFNNLEDVKNFILSGGNFSIIIFMLIQFLQVTVLPIPAAITTIAGALVFGPLKTLILSFIAIMLGSFFAFFLGRVFGKKILIWIAGKEDAEKWTRKLTNGKYLFFLMMLFPIFPDDILCIAAGVTNMSFKFYFFTNLISRPLALISLCYFGSGAIIPFKGTGLIFWAIIVVVIAIIFFLSLKYQDKIENAVDILASKMGRKKTQTQKVKIETLNINDGDDTNNTDSN